MSIDDGRADTVSDTLSLVSKTVIARLSSSIDQLFPVFTLKIGGAIRMSF